MAAASIDAALAETWDRLARARLLDAHVEIVAAGEATPLRAAAAELEELAATYPSPAAEALRGVGKERSALIEMRTARSSFQALGARGAAARVAARVADLERSAEPV